MAKKKGEPIRNLGSKEDSLIVQKSQPLQALWSSKITLPEFKILDLYLGRINSHDDEHRIVIIEKGEIEKAIGVKQIKKEDLKERLSHLMGNVVEIPDNESKKGFRLVTLFEEAEAELDEYGRWQVKLECTLKAKKYFFNVDDLGYYRYKLRCIKNMTSRQTYIMFNYLEANRFRKTWEASLEELKEILECQGTTYNEYKHFNNLILKKIHKDITEKTECRYAYEPIKKGRNVVAIQFTLETRKDLLEEHNTDEIPGQIDLESYLDATKTAQDRLKLACGNEFLPEELDSINAVLMANTDFDRLAEPEEMRLRWVAAKYKEFLVAAERNKKIKHRYKYFLKMLKDDPYKFVPEQKESNVVITKSAQAFHNFEERDTDYDSMILDDLYPDKKDSE